MPAGLREGYVGDFDIPAEWWQTTQTLETERKRADRRHAVRRYAQRVWAGLKSRGEAWRVDRFVAAVGVAYPRGGRRTAVHAAETVKPIIDAGTDNGLWPDDDARHRHATVYFRMPGESRPGQFRITIYIFPVPRSYRAPERLASSAAASWREGGGKADAGWSVTFAVPKDLWMTSNLTDTDMAVLRSGRRHGSWGDGRSLGVRGRVAGLLADLAGRTFRDQGFVHVDRFLAVASVQYPRGNDSDPDNAAETVAQILLAGTQVGAWPDAGSGHCHAVVFCKAPGRCPGGYHIVGLRIIPIPASYHVAAGIASTALEAWKGQTDG